MKLLLFKRALAVAGVVLSLQDSAQVVPAAGAEYNKYASQYDDLDGGAAADVLGLTKLRREAGALVSGKVLEIAVGTGLQASYYTPDAITSYTAVDQSPAMLEQARARLSSSRLAPLKPKLFEMDASRLDFQDNTFDSVIDTFSFCTFDKPEAVLKEMSRVLRPGGMLVLLENSVSTNPLLGRLQDLTEPIVTPLSKSCRWNINVPAIAESDPSLRLVSAQDEQLGTITLRVYKRSLD